MNAAGNEAIGEGPANSLYFWSMSSGVWSSPIEIGGAGTAY
jgi:hypothetical protein